MRLLTDWLALLEQRHPSAIELGLARVAAVWQRLKTGPLARQTIVVGGTNGKGSTVAMLDAIARTHGLRVGCYTSPHLLRFNERIALDGMPVSDAALVAAFERVELALQGVSLTYFEFTTLAAFLILGEAHLDLAVLEVGLGGRLDAVNLIDADASIVTSIDLDHQAWLGPTVEDIGWEKAHIYRRDRPAICGARHPPERLRAHSSSIGAQWAGIDEAFSVTLHDQRFDYSDQDGTFAALALPALRAPVQLNNAACALFALRSLGIDMRPALISHALSRLHLAGRLQRLPYEVETYVDVAHNAQAARELARWLQLNPIHGKTHAVFACLEDKDLDAILAPLHHCFASFALVQLNGPRARGVDEIAAALRKHNPSLPVWCFNHVQDALRDCQQRCTSADRVIAFGSFLIAQQALTNLKD